LLIASCTICMFSWISSCALRDASLTAHSNNIDRSLVNLLSSVSFSLPHCRSWAFNFVKTNGTYWPDALLEKRPPSNPNHMVLATLMACLAKRLAKDQALVQYHCSILVDLVQYTYFIAKW
jgi:hypothetical protein